MDHPTPEASKDWTTRLLVVATILLALLSLGLLLFIQREQSQQQAFDSTTLPTVGEYKEVDLTDEEDPGQGAEAGGASFEHPGQDAAAEGDYDAGRIGEDDLGLHTITGGEPSVQLETDRPSDTWLSMAAGDGEAQDVPESVADAWACHDGQADTVMGQLDWDQARRVSGPAVLIPSVCAVAPMTSTGAAEGTSQLELPTAPWATWYRESAPLDATSGTTYVASHIGFYGIRQFGPFKQLEAVPVGAPIIVRDFDGDYRLYTAERHVSADQASAVEDPELSSDLFRLDGEHQLALVTCERGASGQYDRNEILLATPAG